MSLFTVIPQGPFLSQTAENNCPYHRVVGFLILSGQFIITGMANPAAVREVVWSLLPARASAGNQIETVQKIEEMSGAAGRLARGSRTHVVDLVEMSAWILWRARWMLTVSVGWWWLCVTGRCSAATQTEPCGIKRKKTEKQSKREK